MISKSDAKVGVRVKWQSLDSTIAPSYGKIIAVGPTSSLSDGEIAVKYDDGEDGTTFLDSGASRVFLA
jgi:hypothetical protein